MSPLRSGFEPKSVLMSAARLCVIGVAVVGASGCATSKSPSYVHGPRAEQHAAAPIPQEMEDDGQPVQSPPARTMKAEEDDPTQPWSPNYGKPAHAITPPAKPASDDGRPLPRQVEATLRPSLIAESRGLRVMSDDEVDAIKQAAIAAHEMRNR